MKAYKKCDANYDEYVKNMAKWKDAKVPSFPLIMQHCDPEIEERVMSSGTWDSIDRAQDVVGFLTLIHCEG